MSRRSLYLPISVITTAGLLLILLISGLAPAPMTIAGEPCNEDARPSYLSYDQCQATNTAEAQAKTAKVASPTATNDNSNNGGGSTSNSPTATRTATATVLSSPTLTRTATLTSQPVTPTTRLTGQANSSMTLTPTSLLPADVTELACIPGETVELNGSARPDTALIVTFDQRPVGGGVSGSDGSYHISMQVGAERPGLYLVEVIERHGRALVEQFGCQVPSFTPTPTTVLAP